MEARRRGYLHRISKRPDPTGMTTVLDNIEPGALSEREQRIAAGIQMVRDGSTIKGASKAVRIPLSTLHSYVTGV